MTTPTRLTNPVRTGKAPVSKEVALIADALDTVQAEREAYAAVADTATQAELRTRSDTIKGQMQAVSDSIAAGADPCPSCKAPPHGRVKTPAHERDGAIVPALYEIVCLTCPEQVAPCDDDPAAERVTRTAARAFGSPAEAVAAWNAQVYFSFVRPLSR